MIRVGSQDAKPRASLAGICNVHRNPSVARSVCILAAAIELFLRLRGCLVMFDNAFANHGTTQVAFSARNARGGNVRESLSPRDTSHFLIAMSFYHLWLVFIQSRQLRTGALIDPKKLVKLGVQGQRVTTVSALNKQSHDPNGQGRNGVEIEGSGFENDPQHTVD
jgi:hypothetical protein